MNEMKNYQKLIPLMVATLFAANMSLHCKTRLTVRNNTNKNMEISFGFGEVYMDLKPYEELIVKVGDTFTLSTPFGVAGGYYSDHLDKIEATTIEINSDCYYLGEEPRFYWREYE